MSYDEHLITMAGGDGDAAVSHGLYPSPNNFEPYTHEDLAASTLDAIQDRAKHGDRSYHSHANAILDRRALLSLVREQAAKLEAVEDFIGRLEAASEPRGVEEFYAKGKVSARASAKQLRAALTKAEPRA